jgi:hypothetical protein
MLEVHGYEILVDGCFNADPHPGKTCPPPMTCHRLHSLCALYSLCTVLTMHCTHYALYSLCTVLTMHCTHCAVYSLRIVLTAHFTHCPLYTVSYTRYTPCTYAGNVLFINNDPAHHATPSAPKLGLIDYGQVKRIPKQTRMDFAKVGSDHLQCKRSHSASDHLQCHTHTLVYSPTHTLVHSHSCTHTRALPVASAFTKMLILVDTARLVDPRTRKEQRTRQRALKAGSGSSRSSSSSSSSQEEEVLTPEEDAEERRLTPVFEAAKALVVQHMTAVGFKTKKMSPEVPLAPLYR